ncbi:MAG: sodium-dependent transporter [candidate division Zixibacteria bacterium]|nr:sodium-dependent transporter [candidate division Zixibacteria bacterium]
MVKAKPRRLREHWGSRFGFILAATGSAIGLGNIWKFPYITGEHGGAAFVVVYLICIIIIGLPVMMAELAVGRTAQRNPVGAYKVIRPGTGWFLVGGLGVLAGFVILSYYSVVAGWVMAYVFKAITGAVTRFTADAGGAAAAKGHFESFAARPGLSVLWHFVFMAICTFIIFRGVRSGIEAASKILMPVLIAILLVLVVWSLALPGSAAGVRFYLVPKITTVDVGPLSIPFFQGLTWSAVLIALGHAFFSLSLGMGAMLTYGSYLERNADLSFSTATIAVADTVIALLAGLALLPAVFAMGLAPDGGPGLLFHTLPAVFASMPGGFVFAILFFVLVALAAITSGISVLEVVTAFTIGEMGWRRRVAAPVIGAIIFVIGIPSALSFGAMDKFRLFGLNFFDVMDYLSANFFLPLGGLLIALFVGWGWGPKAIKAAAEGSYHGFPTGRIWLWMCRTITPLAVAAIIVAKVAGVG